MTSSLFGFGSIFRLAARRLVAERSLALAAALGFTAAVALLMSVPLYADGVCFRLLRQAILGEDAATASTPLSFRFRYVGARDGAVQLEDVRALEAYLAGPMAGTLGLRQRSATRHYKTDIFRVHFPDVDPFASKGMTWVSFATVSDLSRHVQVQSGELPAGDETAPDAPVEVLIHEQVALDFGWQVGETLIAQRGDLLIPFRIAGTWVPADPQAGFWSSPLQELALVSEKSFAERVGPCLEDEVYLGLWQIAVDGGDLHAGDIAALLERIRLAERQASGCLPRVVLDDSPVEALRVYQRGVRELTFLLLAFSVPMMGLFLAFVGLVGGLYVERLRNEIATLRSRGASGGQVVGIAALEGLVLGATALVAGSPAGMAVAWLVGQARSFLSFTARADMRVGLTREAAGIGVAAVAIAHVAQLLPTMGAAGHTIVTYKQDQARSLRPPWWQRIWLDGLLLIPTAYGFYVLRQQGSLAAQGGAAVNDLFQDPLLFLTPALGLFALTLFVARLLPPVMAATAWVAARTRSVGLLLATRQLSRAPGILIVPLILLVLTLSLSAFTASLAQTLDGHLAKQVYYKVGADLRLAEMGIGTGVPAGGEGARFFFRPVGSHLEAPSVEAATRVGRYVAVAEMGHLPVTGTFIGIDRLEFPQAAYWQRDFSAEPLGSLMNGLARAPGGVLVTRDFLSRQPFKVGDPLSLIVTAYDAPVKLDLLIVGTIDLFPTWYPDDGPLFVGNLDYFFQETGVELPYEVWLKTNAGADQRRIVAYVRGRTALLDPLSDPSQVVEDGLNIMVTDWWSAPLEITSEQRRPERQGLFGLLSVGFVASALLTVLGILLYALFSFRRRFIEFGVLRAIGLSMGQMAGMLAWELAAVILVGMAAGTGLGVWVSASFIPYLQVGVEASSRYPPFLVVIAWPAIARIYALFGVLFVAALGGLVVLLARMKIAQAIKLGETA